jgi:ribosomal peptide maturation radical SAM protein 1
MPLFNLGLVSMPWPAFNRPSIQLGCLGAYVREHGIHTRLFHPYLNVAHLLGEETYQWIASEVWLCEALYSAILYPEKYGDAKKLAGAQVGRAHQKDFNFDRCVAVLETHLDAFAESFAFDTLDLLGFSICLNQLLPTLCAVKWIKARYPNLPLVLGGSSTHPDAALALIEEFGVDYVIWGEGEQALLGLCRHLEKSEPLPETVYNATGWGKNSLGQIADLSTLPVPDYNDYMAEIMTVFGHRFTPVLPLEFSRGCWWGKCVFCNLNLQWHGYRFKTADQVQQEVSEMVTKYQTLDFTFTDNALPVKESRDFFKWCAEEEADYRFFAEIRGNQRGEELVAMQRGGLTQVQVGIESFSSSLLRRLHKGMRVIDNLAIMRDGVACQVEIEGNLIVDFPSSTDFEVTETVQNLEFVLPFKPLTTASFFLGLNSYVDGHPEEFGIICKTCHANNRRLFPASILDRFPQLIKQYRGDRTVQKKRWAAVVKKVAQWQDFHKKRGKDLFLHPLLSYRDGSDFIIIRQECFDGKVLHHTLRGMSRALYLYILEIHSFAEITAFCPLDKKKLRLFLDDLVQKKIMFNEDDSYLSLAVRSRT